MTKKRIAYVAAHSGGHIIPALTHAHQELKQKEYNEVLFFTSANPLDQKITRRYKQQEIKPIFLPLAGHPKKNSHYFFFSIQLLSSFFMALCWLLWHRPKKIISMGGLISLPVCFAGLLLKIPYELYELNVEPGKAIRLLSRWAQHVYTCFDETKALLPDTCCTKTSYPLRYAAHHKNLDKKTVLDAFQFTPTRTTLLVIGGSQGSLFINQLIVNWLSHYPHYVQKLQIIHQTGDHDPFNYQKWYTSHAIPALVFSYADDLSPYYQIADFAIGRAGAGSIAEIRFFHLKSLLIPLATPATNHQITNAQAAYNQSPDLFSWTPQKSPKELYPHLSAWIDPKKAYLID